MTENLARTNATKEERMTFLLSTKKERNSGWGAALLKRDGVCRQKQDRQDTGHELVVCLTERVSRILGSMSLSRDVYIHH